ncbi:hypothetical protein HKX48_009052 [Thoreauomyces humboldtii]|nr:hypothetical protein HKX48_009052 [Thoreauomyces humboldtii]
MPKDVKPKTKNAASKRKPSAYNLFMKSELVKVKAADPKLDHKEAFKKVAVNWATSPENPKNKK